ncbi:DUF1428 domain-containing protein [Sphingomonas formosensis]
MAYVEGFVVPVPADAKQAYHDLARLTTDLFMDHGACRVAECWADDVPDGTVTDFKGAVQAKTGEIVVFSWVEWASRAARDAGMEAFLADPRMHRFPDPMPFEGQRMIHAGFEPIVDEANPAAMGYVDGFLIAVPKGNREAYRVMATKAAAVFQEHGATRIVEAWGDDVPAGKVTDFRRAVKAEPDEAVMFSWVEWPSRAARDAGNARVMADPRMQPGTNPMPFDGKRMIYGGFAPILDVAETAHA